MSYFVLNNINCYLYNLKYLYKLNKNKQCIYFKRYNVILKNKNWILQKNKYILKNDKYFNSTESLNIVKNTKENENNVNKYEKEINTMENKNEIKSSLEESKKNVLEINNTYANENIDNTNENEKILEKKKMSKSKIYCYGFSAIFLSYVFYKIYKNNMNLSKAEESITKDFVKLFYSYDEKQSIQNSQFLTSLNEDLKRQLAIYFIQLDTDKHSGFLRNDALNFLQELNIKEENEIIKKFIQNGIGKHYELKKLSGCSLQEFADLIENLILQNKTKDINEYNKKPQFENTKQFYINYLQYYLDSLKYYFIGSKLHLYIQKKRKKTNDNIKEIDNLENLILEKFIEHNKKYVNKNNLPLIYLLSEDELKYNRNNIVMEKEAEKEILLIEKKKIEDKIELLNNLYKKKKYLNEIELKRLNYLKLKLKDIKRTIRKEKLKRYFLL